MGSEGAASLGLREDHPKSVPARHPHRVDPPRPEEQHPQPLLPVPDHDRNARGMNEEEKVANFGVLTIVYTTSFFRSLEFEIYSQL